MRWYRCDSINKDLNEEGLQGIEQYLTGSSLERITCTYDDNDSDDNGDDENDDDGDRSDDDDDDDNYKW